MAAFRVGDRVSVTRAVLDHGYDIFTDFIGHTGTIRRFEVRQSEPYGVEWDQPFDAGHTLGGIIGGHRGWWVAEDCLRHVDMNLSSLEKEIRAYLNV